MPLTLADVESVGAYLRDREMDGDVTSVDALVGGVSSDIFLVRRSVPPDWVVKQALPNLRVAVDWPSDPLRIHREAAALRWLETVLSPGSVAAAVFEDHEAHVLIMEAVPEPCPTWKALLLDGDLRTVHVEDIGLHYAKTLRCWRDRFFARIDEVRSQGYSEDFIRMWDFYLTFCEGAFLERAIGDVQMLIMRPHATFGEIGR